MTTTTQAVCLSYIKYVGKLILQFTGDSQYIRKLYLWTVRYSKHNDKNTSKTCLSLRIAKFSITIHLFFTLQGNKRTVTMLYIANISHVNVA